MKRPGPQSAPNTRIVPWVPPTNSADRLDMPDADNARLTKEKDEDDEPKN
jgi:hypothetical protein